MTHNFPFASKLGTIVSSFSADAVDDDDTIDATNESLFFVSKGDGTHIFSTTLEAHNAAVNMYQRHK